MPLVPELPTTLKALCYLISLDVITGVLASAKLGHLQSSVATNGLFKKVGIFLCVYISMLLDQATHSLIFVDMTITAFSFVEAMSIIENIEKAGYGYIIPKTLRRTIKERCPQERIKDETTKNKHNNT